MPDKKITPELATVSIGKMDLVLPNILMVGGLTGPYQDDSFAFEVLFAPNLSKEDPKAKISPVSWSYSSKDLSEIAKTRSKLVTELNRYHMGNISYASSIYNQTLKESVEKLLKGQMEESFVTL